MPFSEGEPHRGVHFYAGEQHSKALVSALVYFLAKAAEARERVRMWRLASHDLPPVSKESVSQDPVRASVAFYHRNPLDTKISAVVIEN